MGIAKRKWPAGAALACALVCVASTSDASEPAKKPPPRLWGRQEVTGPAPPLISSLLADPDWAEDVLFRGELHYKEPGVPDVKVIRVRRDKQLVVRVGIVGPDGEVVHGVFKARHVKGFYRNEWRRELAFYRLARYLGVHGVVPVVERTFPSEIMAAAVAELPRSYRDLWQLEPGGEEVRGSFMLWVWGIRHRLNGKMATRSHLIALAQSTRPGRRDEILEDPVRRQLAEMFVIDYVTYNNDRRGHNFGGILQEEGPYRLTMIDNGDAFSGTCAGQRHSTTVFRALRMFPRELVERLAALDTERTTALLRTLTGEPLVSSRTVVGFLRCRDAALRQVRGLERSYGDDVWFSMADDDARFWHRREPPTPDRTNLQPSRAW